MKKILYLALFFFIPYSFCYETDHYVIKNPGEPAPLVKLKRSRRPIEEYTNLQIQDEDVIAAEKFKIAKEIELEGRVPYQESRRIVNTPTSGSTSNK